MIEIQKEDRNSKSLKHTLNKNGISAPVSHSGIPTYFHLFEKIENLKSKKRWPQIIDLVAQFEDVILNPKIKLLLLLNKIECCVFDGQIARAIVELGSKGAQGLGQEKDLWLGISYLKLGLVDKANKIYIETLLDDSDQAWAWVGLAICHRFKGDHELAHACFLRCNDIDQVSSAPYGTLVDL